MIDYILVDEDHDVCNSTCPFENQDMLDFWESSKLQDTYATGACLAYHNQELVGFARFYKDDLQLLTLGTYVLKKNRRQGLAKEMWRRIIGPSNVLEVVFTVTTEDGNKLFNHLSKDKTLNLKKQVI